MSNNSINKWEVELDVLKAAIISLQDKINAEGLACCVTSGEVIGNTLILYRSSLGNINIPLTDTGGVDFNNLTPAQCTALSNQLVGNIAEDAFGQYLGHWLEDKS